MTSSRSPALSASSQSKSWTNLRQKFMHVLPRPGEDTPHTSSSRPGAAAPIIHPLPTRLTELVSTEIYEQVITYCTDKATLLACMRVCRAWVPRARFILFSRVICRPRVVIPSGTTGSLVSCVALYRGPDSDVEELIHGNSDGVYHSASRRILLRVKHVSQMAILVEYDLFLCLADGLFSTLPLDRLLSGHAHEHDLTVLSKHVHAFDVLRDGAKAQVCVRKGSSRNGIIKVFETRRGVSSGQGAGQPATWGLHKTREMFVPSGIHSLRQATMNMLVVGLQGTGGFEVIHVQTAETQSLLDPNDFTLKFVFRNKSLRALECIRSRDQERFLVCYDKFGLFVNLHGNQLSEPPMMRWSEGSPPIYFALKEPYLLAFTSTCLYVWWTETGGSKQTVLGQYTLLNAVGRDERIFLMAHGSGDVVELVFNS
ncbi:unnamed protein product [Mycena citricolor]|uniref:CNH domain-containing protein n=1 Tax=Mycena citricolor TaxID=2018698 RepID=A0AAD2H1G3_9AGAR|nr:unnamed protein product [Mycena citricolor]